MQCNTVYLANYLSVKVSHCTTLQSSVIVLCYYAVLQYSAVLEYKGSSVPTEGFPFNWRQEVVAPSGITGLQHSTGQQEEASVPPCIVVEYKRVTHHHINIIQESSAD